MLKCLDCDAGTASRSSGTSCRKCKPGSWSRSGAADCTACKTGLYDKYNRRTNVARDGPAVCRACAPGKWSNVSQATSCIECIFIFRIFPHPHGKRRKQRLHIQFSQARRGLPLFIERRNHFWPACLV